MDDYSEEIDNLTRRVDAVLEYIEANPNSDPNAYEMTQLTIEVGEIGWKVRKAGEGSKEDPDVTNGYEHAMKHESLTELRKKYFDMMDKRLQTMKEDSNNLGLSEDSSLYKFLENKREDMITYNCVATDEDKEPLCKLAGMVLHQRQCERDLGRKMNTHEIYDDLSKLEVHFRGRDGASDEVSMINEIQGVFMESKYFDGRLEINRQDGIKGLSNLVNGDEVITECLPKQGETKSLNENDER